MKIVQIYTEGKIERVSLQEKLHIQNENLPKSWIEIVDEISTVINIKTPKEYKEFLNTYDYYQYFLGNKFIPPIMKEFYEMIKISKYNKMFDDDILKYISYTYIFGLFDIIGYDLSKNNLDDLLNSNNPFRFGYTEEQLKYRYSIIDLLPLKYGMNGIRELLLDGGKKIFH